MYSESQNLNTKLNKKIINITNKRYVTITVSSSEAKYGVLFIANQDEFCFVNVANNKITKYFTSKENGDIKIDTSSLTINIDYGNTYSHGFIIPGGSLTAANFVIS